MDQLWNHHESAAYQSYNWSSNKLSEVIDMKRNACNIGRTQKLVFFGVILSFIFPGNLPKANNFIEITYDMAEQSHLKIFVHPGN